VGFSGEASGQPNRSFAARKHAVKQYATREGDDIFS